MTKATNHPDSRPSGPGVDRGGSNTPSRPVAIDSQALQAQKMEAIGRLAGGVAHDFNNLLMIINGYSESLLALLHDNEPACAALGEIRRAGERAAALTRQLLAFSRKQILKPQVVDLNGLVLNFEKMLRRLIGEDVELATQLCACPLFVKVDPGQMEQVLMNLAVNARDAMPCGGKLTITTARAELEELPGDGPPRAPRALLRVSDNGLGMDEQVMTNLFEPFFTTKEPGKGTGLGLSTVYGIVQASGGQITVQSQPGQGSVFTIALPIVEESLTAELAPAYTPIPARGAETILLVEDEESVRNLVRLSLEAKGYRVLGARHGIDALSRCDKYRGRIDVVITDVVMPFLGGVELVQRLKQRYPHIKALYMSGYNESALIRQGIEYEQLAYLSKPFTGSELVQSVRNLLDEPSGLQPL